ncbi:MAG TPA: DM13 domain-containing protein [Terriglobales bacterium]|jgi:Electron transfer DM13|nr:DM13 domain-containing protein [Terriglobales bacterium]
MKRKPLIYGFLILLAVIGWAAFRPERLFINAKVNETLPTTQSTNTSETVLASGKFHSVAHESSGNASIYQLADGKRILRLTNFATSNGPDVHVYLVAANDATDSETVKKAGFVELGSLKGNIGDQNYELPADLDLSKYRAVTIWCQRFGVNFGTAPISTEQAGLAHVLATGAFHSVAHQSAGQATILQLADGKRVLRFTNFQTSNGPDVRVYLVASGDANDSDTVKKAGFVEVAALKGNIGDQNYEIASNLDLNKYRAVTIWCKRFSVNFATAPLSSSSSPMAAMEQ